jgi:hypothetical protein
MLQKEKKKKNCSDGIRTFSETATMRSPLWYSDRPILQIVVYKPYSCIFSMKGKAFLCYQR